MTAAATGGICCVLCVPQCGAVCSQMLWQQVTGPELGIELAVCPWAWPPNSESTVAVVAAGCQPSMA